MFEFSIPWEIIDLQEKNGLNREKYMESVFGFGEKRYQLKKYFNLELPILEQEYWH